VNVPGGKISNSFFEIGYIWGPKNSSDTDYFAGPYNFNFLGLTSLNQNALYAEEMWNIDVKMDDGNPAYGKIFTVKDSSIYGPNCATSDSAATAAYDFSNTATRCPRHSRNFRSTA
jgi:hypothetical protein